MSFLLFILNIIGTFIAAGIVAWLFVWPWLQKQSKDTGLKALITPHAFRFIGISFLIPGVTGLTLPVAFAAPAAWGDFAAAVLAILSLVALAKHWKMAIPLIWFFNIWGTIDLLFAFYNGPVQLADAGQFGAAYYIPTFIVPMLLVGHFLIFKLLLNAKANVSKSKV